MLHKQVQTETFTGTPQNAAWQTGETEKRLLVPCTKELKAEALHRLLAADSVQQAGNVIARVEVTGWRGSKHGQP